MTWLFLFIAFFEQTAFIMGNLENQRVDLEIEVLDIAAPKGKVYLAIFREGDPFPDASQAFEGQIIPVDQKGTVAAVFENMPVGKYAIAAFHDVNGNGKLDTNLLGIPIEPYGFSNQAKGKWKKPSFPEAAVSLDPSNQRFSIKLALWKGK